MFFDTNVLVRARFEAAPRHLLARRRMSEIGRTDEPLRISRQVLREYSATVTRPQPWSVQIPMDEALEHVARLTGVFGLLEDGPGVTDLPSGRSAPFLPMGPASVQARNLLLFPSGAPCPCRRLWASSGTCSMQASRIDTARFSFDPSDSAGNSAAL